MQDSPLPRAAALSGGLIGVSALVIWFALGSSLAQRDTAALTGLPQASQDQAATLYTSVRWLPMSGSADFRLGEFFLTNDRPQAAVPWLKRAIRWNTAYWQGWYCLGLAHRAARQYSDAAADFRKVIELNPEYVAARVQLGFILLDQGRAADAEQALTALLRTGADQNRVTEGIGLSLLRQGNYRAAQIAFEQVLTKFALYGDAHAGLSAALKAMGDQQRAAREAKLAQNWRGVVPLLTDDPVTEQMEQDFPTAHSLFRQAARNRDPKLSAETMEKALALDPGMAAGWELIISMYGQAHRPRDAEHAWGQLAQIDPGNLRGRYDLAVALGQAGERAKSAAYLNQVLAADPSYNEAHRMLGQLAELDGNIAEATRQFRIAYTNDPTLAEAHTDLALMLLKAGQTKEAEAEFLRALLPPCDSPERTLLRELAMLRDNPWEPTFEQAVRTQAEQKQQPALITMLNTRKKPAVPKPVGLPGLTPGVPASNK